MELTRNRDWYILTKDDSGKQIKYNFATGECIGVSGKTLKRVNPDISFVSIIRNKVEETSNNNYREFMDRLISLQPFPLEILISVLRDLEWSAAATNIINRIITDKKEWRDFLTYLNITDMEKIRYSWRPGVDLLNGYDTYAAVKDLKCSDRIKSVVSKYSPPNLATDYANKVFNKMLALMDNMVIHLDAITEMMNNSSVRLDDDNDNDDILYQIYTNSMEYIRGIDRILHEYPSITPNTRLSLHEQYRDVSKQCEILRFAEEQKIFHEHQINGNLEYENEKYRIEVPTTYEDCQNIGNYFHNCASGHEWNNYLSNGNRYLVVVVEKKTNTPKVCCDISKGRKIQQYLGKYNDAIKDNALKEFKNEYQNYLKG